MRPKTPGRRSLFQAAGALLTGTAVAFTAKPSFSFRIEEIDANSPIGQSYAAGCGPASDHNQLIAELRAELETEEMQALSAVCPLCGCRVTARRR